MFSGYALCFSFAIILIIQGLGYGESMHKYLSILIVFVIFFSAVAVYGASQQRNLMEKLLYSRDSSFGGLADSSSNSSFFEHKLDRSTLEAVEAVVGENLFRSLRLGMEEGKSVSDFIESNQETLREHPFVLAALVHNVTKANNVPLAMVDEDSDEEKEIDIADPARTISASDLHEYALGPDGSPRNFRHFLSRNYGLTNSPPMDRPDEISAMSVFFNYAANAQNGDSGSDSDYDKLLTDRFVRDAGRGDNVSAPDADAKDLFLPSAETLKKLQELLSLHKKLKAASESGHNPALSSISKKTLQNFMEKAGVSDVSELRNLSIDDIGEHLSGFVNDVVKEELKENDYVAETSSVAVGSDEKNSDADPDSGSVSSISGNVQPSFVAGNDEATSAVNLIYSDAMSPLTESQRTKLEMENGGLFHITGNPEDVQEGAKLYHFLGTPDISDGYLSLMERPREASDK